MKKELIKELCFDSFIAGKNDMKDRQFEEWFERKWEELKEETK